MAKSLKGSGLDGLFSSTSDSKKNKEGKKETTKLHCDLDKDLKIQLDIYCATKQTSIKRVVEEALSAYLAKKKD